MESSLLELMSSSLKQRLTAEPVRFVYQRDMPNEMVELRGKLGISNYDSVIAGGRYHNFKDFISFPNVGKANSVNKPLPRLRHLVRRFPQRLRRHSRKRRAALLPVPHLRARAGAAAPASFDPSVLAIKINIYRVAKDSRIIESMIHAAQQRQRSRWWSSCRRASTKEPTFTGRSA